LKKKDQLSSRTAMEIASPAFFMLVQSTASEAVKNIKGRAQCPLAAKEHADALHACVVVKDGFQVGVEFLLCRLQCCSATGLLFSRRSQICG
jgi:hypothetical protein